MKLTCGKEILAVEFSYYMNNVWIPIPDKYCENGGMLYTTGGENYACSFKINQDGNTEYVMCCSGKYRTALRMVLTLPGNGTVFHVIPCCIYGDNNFKEARTGEFPILTYEHPEVSYCSPFWEYRADRAAMPVSAVCTEYGVAAVSVEPYSDSKDSDCGYIRNGLIAALPRSFGVSLGYTNDPCTMKNKRDPEPSVYDRAKTAKTTGTIYFVPGERRKIHDIIRKEYWMRRERPSFLKSYKEAAAGLLDSLVSLSWSPKDREYTNIKCCPPDDRMLRPWRDVVEIGWTGGGILAYPLILVRDVLGKEADKKLKTAMSGEEIFNRITEGYNPVSGLYYDLMRTMNGSRVNGWWTGFGLVKDCHCSYTNGSALHYILKTILYLKNRNRCYPVLWLKNALKVMDNVISLQRQDGAFGYTFAEDCRRVKDWQGFAGCWFAAAAAYAYQLTGIQKYEQAAEKALNYYHAEVEQLICCGTPMDTWKSVDEEGNLAFIRACRIVHENSQDPKWLNYLKDGADYECLWRYGYKTRPDFEPLSCCLGGWNSCGGSVTSVSNPHIHPMGAIVNEDLFYLGEKTGDIYYCRRAEDGIAWLMQTLEMYPEQTGYGQYGVLSERWCPSDGLTIERYSDGRPYSSWFSSNLWAVANALELVCEEYLKAEEK